MGRGRSGALFFVLFVGLDSVSFTAEGNGEVTAGRLGWMDTKYLLTCFTYAHNSRSLEKSVLQYFQVCVCVCIYLWCRRIVHLRSEDL